MQVADTLFSTSRQADHLERTALALRRLASAVTGTGRTYHLIMA